MRPHERLRFVSLRRDADNEVEPANVLRFVKTMMFAATQKRLSLFECSEPPRQRCNQSGVTLIELMVVVAIAGIVLSVAVPDFREFVTRNRLDGAAQGIFVSLQVARTEAMRRGEQVTMRLNGAAGSKNWGGGWTAFVDSNRNGELDPGEEVLIEQAPLTAPLSVFASNSFATSVAFNRDGRLTSAGGLFVVCDGGVVAESGRSRSRAVLVNGAGRARMAARNSAAEPLADTGVVTSCSNP